MLNQTITRFLRFTKKEEFTLLDYLIHFAVGINLLVALAITLFVLSRS
ncbi:MAG: hypothetical protein HQK87_01250 [Nitrospinae bacterium]|nr:hypothetical protein [Nitrospinota bacterium]